MRPSFKAYFEIFPFSDLPDHAEGFDLGCGSGRWAAGLVDRVGNDFIALTRPKRR